MQEKPDFAQVEKYYGKIKWIAEPTSFLSFFKGNQILVSKPDRDDPDLYTRHYFELNNKYIEFLHERDAKNKCGSFFCVNNLNRGLDPTKQRSKEMWINSRAVWCDDDKESPHVRFDFPIKPNLVVNTSPGKYHYYWLTHTDNKEEWLAVMNALPEITNTDEAVKDLPRIMRLPGFHHNKREPYLVKFFIANPDPYTWEEIVAAFPPNYDHAGKLETRNSYQEENAINQILTADNFHQAFTRLAMSKANTTTDRDLIMGYLRGLMFEARHNHEFPQDRIERWETVMSGPEIPDAVDSALRIVKREKQDETGNLLVNPDSTVKFARGEKVPDEIIFPENAMITELAEALMETWWIPNKMIAALTARHTIAYLAGGNYRSSIGDRVNIQQVALGDTGSGKDLLVSGIQAIIQCAFEDSHEKMKELLGGVINEAGSAEGIDDRIRCIGDKHDLILVRDEIGDMFKAAAQGNIYKASILNYALKMYTQSNTVSNERAKAKKKGDPESTILYAPHFIISGATTPALIMEGLTSDLVSTGSMSRMVFFNVDHHKGKRLQKIKDLKLPAHVISCLRQIVNTDALARGLYTMPSARLYNPKIVNVPDDVVQYCYEEACRDDDRGGEWSAIWNRRVPNAKKYAMIEAICENPVKPEITMPMMERALTLVEYSIQYTIDLFNHSVGHGQCDLGIKALLRKMMTSPDRWWKRVELMNTHPVVKLNPRDKEMILTELVQNGCVLFDEKNNVRGKTSKMYKITDIGKNLIGA